MRARIFGDQQNDNFWDLAQWFVFSQKRTFKVHLSIVRVPEDIQKCTIHLCKAFSMLKNIFAYLKVLLLI